MAEMVTYLPISSPFIRFAGRYVDEAFGFAAGWNFFIFEAALVPFEITACNVIIHYWSDIVPAGAIIAIVIILYGSVSCIAASDLMRDRTDTCRLINLLAVQWYGESEFWAALGKVFLIVGLLIFTFIAMVGGNPLHDRFGFRYACPGTSKFVASLTQPRYWQSPGAFAELYYSGPLGRWLGFLQCLIQASFTIAG